MAHERRRSGCDGLPEWVKSFGLPPEAVEAIDRWWQPASDLTLWSPPAFIDGCSQAV